MINNNENLIYKRQLAFLIIVMSFTFKVSRLPPLMVQYMENSGLLMILFYLILEVITFFIIYKFINLGGMPLIDQGGNKIVNKILMSYLAFYFITKFCLMYAGTVLFVMEILFEAIDPLVVSFTLILPIFYLAWKGMRTIARTSEILTWLAIGVLLINLLFLNTELNFRRNLPLLNDSFFNYLKSGNIFYFWFGDFTPFLFLTLKSSKRNYIKFVLPFSMIMILVITALTNAIYGDSAMYITNLIVKIASLNQFADKLGRLDWTGMITWLLMGILFLSVFLWAAIEAGTRIVNKRNWIAIFLGITVVVVDVVVEEKFKFIKLVLSNFKYVAVVGNYLIPIIFLLMALQIKKKKGKRESKEPITSEKAKSPLKGGES